jgi:hypothetical protein
VHHRRVIQFTSLEPKEEMKLAQRPKYGWKFVFSTLNVNSQNASFLKMGISRPNFQKADSTTSICPHSCWSSRVTTPLMLPLNSHCSSCLATPFTLPLLSCCSRTLLKSPLSYWFWSDLKLHFFDATKLMPDSFGQDHNHNTRVPRL